MAALFTQWRISCAAQLWIVGQEYIYLNSFNCTRNVLPADSDMSQDEEDKGTGGGWRRIHYTMLSENNPQSSLISQMLAYCVQIAFLKLSLMIWIRQQQHEDQGPREGNERMDGRMNHDPLNINIIDRHTSWQLFKDAFSSHFSSSTPIQWTSR